MIRQFQAETLVIGIGDYGLRFESYQDGSVSIYITNNDNEIIHVYKYTDLSEFHRDFIDFNESISNFIEAIKIIQHRNITP
jgi:hypothetical protein